MPIKEFLQMLVKELGVKREEKAQEILRLEFEFKKNLFFNSEQLCKLQEDEWITLTSFVPINLIQPMQRLLNVQVGY